MQLIQKWWITQRWVIVVLLVGLVVRGTIAYWLPPGFDEAYYYLYTLHPALSYFDHPPLVMLTTAVGIWLTGEVSQFTIRLGSLLLYVPTLFFLYRTASQLFSVPVGRLTLLLASMIPIFQIGFGTLTLPDVPLMFFWSLTLWVAAEEFFARETYQPTYRLAVLGLLVGCACLGKYHGLLLGFGLLGFCLTSRGHRSALRSPWAGLGLVLFLLAFSPVLLWNGQQDWVSFRFQGKRGVPNRGYNVGNALKTALVAAAYLFPTIGLPLWAVGLRRGFGTVKSWWLKPQQQERRQGTIALLIWIAAPPVLIFTLIGGYQQILPTWTMPGFFAATPLLADRVLQWQQHHPRAMKRWLQGSGVAIGALMLVALLHISAGIFQKPGQYAIGGGWISPQADPSIQLIDIQQLRQGFLRSPALKSELQEADFLFSNRFHLAGHIGMALTPLYRTPVTCFDKRDMRGFAFWSKAEDWLGQDGLYLVAESFQSQAEAIAEFSPYFERFIALEDVPLRRGGEVIDRVHVFRGEKLLKPYPRPNEGIPIQ